MEQVSMKSLAIRYGIILGVISTVINLGLIVGGVSTDPTISAVSSVGSIIISIAFMVVVFNTFKRGNEGYMEFKDGFKGGTLLMVISGVISTLVQYVYIAFIDPDYMKNIRAQAEEQMLQNPQATEESMELIEKIMSFTTSPEFILISGIIGSAIFGAILALIVAAIMKKTPEYY